MMKRFSLYMLLFVLLPGIGLAQEQPMENVIAFYTQLAQRDAAYEYNISLSTLEDEKDFWKDQIRFEEQLADKNPMGYHIYLKTKSEAYRSYQKQCAGSCAHSEHYFRRAAFYSVNAIPATELVLALDTKKPQSKD